MENVLWKTQPYMYNFATETNSEIYAKFGTFLSTVLYFESILEFEIFQPKLNTKGASSGN